MRRLQPALLGATCVLFSVVGSPLQAATLTIGPGGTYVTIQSAIDAAISRDELVVNQGTYKESLDFKGKSLILRSAKGASSTFLQSSATTLLLNKGETSDTLIQGFTIQGGAYALNASGSSPKLQDCIFQNSTGTYTAYMDAGAQVSFQSVTFQNNKTSNTFYLTGSGTRATITSSAFTSNTGANGGAIIATSGTRLDLQSTTFTSNTATSSYGGAIYATGAQVTLKGCTFTKNKGSYGGAMYMDGSSTARLLVTGSKFNGNTGTYGGGLYLANITGGHLSDNSFQENVGTTEGGALYVYPSSHLSLINNTIVGNDSAKGGGIYLRENASLLLLQNIVARNTNGYGIQAVNATSRMVVWYNDLYDNYKGNYGGYTGLVDPTGTQGNLAVDPQLKAYSRDGNFSNDDLSLASSSPLIDAGSASFTDADGSPSDLGVGGGDETPEVEVGVATVSPLGTGTYTSIKEAASAARSGDKIKVYPGNYFGDIDFAGKSLSLSSAYGSATVSVGSGTTTLKLALSEASDTLVEGLFVWSTSSYAIQTNASSPTFKDVIVAGCTGSYGAYFYGGKVSWMGGGFYNNTVSSAPLYAEASNVLYLENVTFEGNSAANGGALYASNSTITLQDVVFRNNKASASGGAIYTASAAKVTGDGLIFERNQAVNGGAIYWNSAARMTLSNSQLLGNKASTSGGGIYVVSTPGLHLLDCLLVENVATADGGAMYVSTSSYLALINNTLVGNGASRGGHIFLRETTTSFFLQNIFADAYLGESLYISTATTRWLAWYNNFYGGPKGDVGGVGVSVIGSQGNISEDPGFVAWSLDGDFTNDDLSLDTSSPLIDAGSQTFLDEDGSPSDLGAGGGDDLAAPPNTGWVVSPLPDADAFSIKTAAAAAISGDTIYVYPGIYYDDMDYAGKDITIAGVFGPETVAITGSTPFTVKTGERTARLQGVTLFATASYALTLTNVAMTLDSVHFRGCYGSYLIYGSSGGTYQLTDVVAEDNTPTTYGFYFGAGKVSVTRGRFSRNKLGGGGMVQVDGAGTLTVTDSLFDTNTSSNSYGGAISANNANLLVSGSRFLRNTAANGAAIYNDAGSTQSMVRDSTFFLNKATTNGGAFQLQNGRFHILDNVLVENEAVTGGGFYLSSGARASLLNNTLVGNKATTAGGISVRDGADALITNNIIALSPKGVGIHGTSTTSRAVVTYTDVYGNVDGDYGGTYTSRTGSYGNLSVDPGFKAYSLNGILTDDDLSLATSSPLRNKGLPGFPDKDGSYSDMGAGGGDDSWLASGYDYHVSLTASGGYSSLASAVAAASAGKKIAVYPGLYYGDTDFAGKTLSVTGVAGAQGTVLEGTNSGTQAALMVKSGEGTSSSPMQVKGLTLMSNGTYALYVKAAWLTLEDCAIRYVTGTYGVYVDAGTLNLTRFLFEGNRAGSYQVYLTTGAKITTSGSTYRDTVSGSYALFYVASTSVLNVTSSRFLTNKSNTYGGAIYATASQYTVSDSLFQGNSSATGGAIYGDSTATGAVSTSMFLGNSVTGNGGAYYGRSGGTSFYNNIFQGNTAANGAGAFVDTSQNDNFTNNTFVENAATGNGSSIYANSSSRLLAVNNIYAMSPNGEAVYLKTGITSYDLRYSDFYQNVDGTLAGATTLLPSSCVTADPKFVAYSQDGNLLNDDLHLATGSSLIDGGDPSYQDTADGSRSDMGAYGGSGGPGLDKDGDGYLVSQGDCDDGNAATYPGATEVADSLDNDCNGGKDEPFVDVDGDGYSPMDGDCDEKSSSRNPGKAEVCDGIDNNCDQVVDEGVKGTYYKDGDGDGYGDAAQAQEACSQPTGFVEVSGDCDDASSSAKPSAAEKCNGVDDNCDGAVDEGLASTYYADADGDTFGDENLAKTACSAPTGYVTVSGDCDETASSVHPGATEKCNSQDDNCDGQVDEGVTKTWYLDSDGDGYGNSGKSSQACAAPTHYSATGGDCNDDSSTIYPSAKESCDSQDNDCDGAVDEGLSSAWYLDADGDGFGTANIVQDACKQPAGYVSSAADCDDTLSSVKPGATETCDGVDNDCDGVIDENLAKAYYPDADGDGYGDSSRESRLCSSQSGYITQGGDCDDTTNTIHPGAKESCNELDDDCDGLKDEGLGATTFYLDADDDTYGSASSPKTTCGSKPNGYVSGSGDCDDSSSTIHPGATETCNEIDDDCDGKVDDGQEQTTYYADADGDGYGETASSLTTCRTAPAGYTAASGDCNDSSPSIHPGATEKCDGVDSDCDGDADNGFDQDGDGVVSCSLQGAKADCNDGEPSVYPGATELCDKKDNDCDGVTDEVEDVDGDGFTGCGTPRDCDDKDPKAYPGAKESCDGVDNDCDGSLDEGFDLDRDGFSQCAIGDQAADCADYDSSIYPGAEEVCDGVDNDCDGETDTGLLITWCMDSDGDGFGDPATRSEACEIPRGGVAGCTDLDDEDALTYPGALEQPDQQDNDGDGLEDEQTDYSDDDGDGFNEAQENDCNDANIHVYPGATEYEDNLDNDCDGQIDELLDSTDDDGDGFSEATGDCDDTQNAAAPGALEVGDQLDNDCDGRADEDTSLADDDGDGLSEADGDCDDTNMYSSPAGLEYADGEDNDCDGLVDEELDEVDDDGDGLSEAEGDFDDRTHLSYPGAAEEADYLDNDGDGQVDEGTDFADDDNDGFSEAAGDCDDRNSYLGPAAEELPGNGQDENCNGQIDETNPVEAVPAGRLGAEKLSFGEVELNTQSTGSVALYNEGDAALTVKSVKLSTSSGVFEVMTASSVLIPAQGQYELWFRFTPTVEGPASSVATILTDDPKQASFKLSLEGTGLAPATSTPTEETPTPAATPTEPPTPEATATPEPSPTPTATPEATTPPQETTPPDDTPPDDTANPTCPPVDEGGCSTSGDTSRGGLSGLLLLGLLGALGLRRRARGQ